MNNLMKKLKILPILVSTTLLAVSANVPEVKAQSTSENAWGKSIDLGWYCTQKYPQPGATVSAVLVNNNVTGWKCRVTYGYLSADYGIDISDACQAIYGTHTHGYGRFTQPYSWFCDTPKRNDYEYIRWG
jgi:hypothetical protein